MPFYNPNAYATFPYATPMPQNQNGVSVFQGTQKANPIMPQSIQFQQYAFVNGIDGANAFPLALDQSILLMDCNHPLAFMKTNVGGQMSLRYFSMPEISEQEARNILAPKTTPTNDFVTKSDFENLKSQITTILKDLKPKEE